MEEAMQKSRFSEEQMVKILREADKSPVAQVSKKHGVSEQTIYAWRKRFGKTISRIIDAFPADEQEQVRISLSESLTAVVSQLLLPTSDGKGRVAVHEILLRTTGLANMIREGNTIQLQSLIQSGKAQGMQLMDDALFALVKEEKILPMDAYRKALDKSRFELMVGEPAA
jgi:Tfp pilus assembly pilus retraction ATPase PilT